MYPNQQSNKYLETKIQTASPDQLLLMLFDGAIRYCRAGIEATHKGQYSDAHQNLMRVQDIITELMVTVNQDVDISKNLLQLYEYFIHRLIEANAQKKPEPAEEVLSYLLELKETWTQAALKVREVRKADLAVSAANGVNYG